MASEQCLIGRNFTPAAVSQQHTYSLALECGRPRNRLRENYGELSMLVLVRSGANRPGSPSSAGCQNPGPDLRAGFHLLAWCEGLHGSSAPTLPLAFALQTLLGLDRERPCLSRTSEQYLDGTT